MRYMSVQEGRKLIVSFDVLKYELMQAERGCIGLFYDKCRTVHILYGNMTVDEAEKYLRAQERDEKLFQSGCGDRSDLPEVYPKKWFRFYGTEPVGLTFKSAKDLSKEAIRIIEERLEKETNGK